jgi:hypothetical protein
MRRRSPERVRVWRDLLDAWQRSGQTVNAFCRDRKLTRSNFDRWRRILARDPSESSRSSAFVPVRVVAEPMVEVVLLSGIVVRLPLSAAPEGVIVGRYLDDARFAIDNGDAERAIRPIAVGRANWLQIGGDGGLPTASVLLSLCASARRSRLDPWAYLAHVLSELTIRTPGADLADLLPDERARTLGRPERRPVG